jgi:crotonobetainyl-CoA:carnitine CoA-transferase CaiB-like acyl-CoA transferase
MGVVEGWIRLSGRRIKLTDVGTSVLPGRPDWVPDMQHLPAAGVRTVEEALQAPRCWSGTWWSRFQEDTGPIDVLGSSFKFEQNRLAEFKPPPLRADHTDDVLASVLGMDEAAIAALRADGTVA